ncbi:MAG: hypothetical protein M1820_009043 [Bogoriella megaspora]|nr:MAG: hypothetical protein M1820_009043 [Bogoriella megaspora]
MNDEIDYVVFDQVTGQLLKTGLAEDCDKEHIWDTNLHRGRILLCIERRDSPRGLQLNVVLRQTVTLFTLYKTETITMQMIEDVLTNNWAAHFCPHSLRAGRARSIFPVGLEKASWNLSFPSQGAPFHIWHCPHEGCKSQLRLLYKKQEYLVGDRGLDEFVDVKVQSVRNLGTLEDALDGMWLSQLELPVGSPF